MVEEHKIVVMKIYEEMKKINMKLTKEGKKPKEEIKKGIYKKVYKAFNSTKILINSEIRYESDIDGIYIGCLEELGRAYIITIWGVIECVTGKEYTGLGYIKEGKEGTEDKQEESIEIGIKRDVIDKTLKSMVNGFRFKEIMCKVEEGVVVKDKEDYPSLTEDDKERVKRVMEIYKGLKGDSNKLQKGVQVKYKSKGGELYGIEISNKRYGYSYIVSPKILIVNGKRVKDYDEQTTIEEYQKDIGMLSKGLEDKIPSSLKVGYRNAIYQLSNIIGYAYDLRRVIR